MVDTEKAAFDLTELHNTEFFEELLDEHNLTENNYPDRFTWESKTLRIQTTCNPFTGEHYRHSSEDGTWNPEERINYTGYIHITGHRDAVQDAYNKIKQNSNYKESSLGYFCV